MIIVDYRDKLLARKIQEYGIKVKIDTLKIGDVMFNNFLIERKSMSDFYNSITTRRLFEQLYGLGELSKDYFTMLIIEEHPVIIDRYFYKVLATLIVSYCKKMNVGGVVTVPDIDTTAYLIAQLYVKSGKSKSIRPVPYTPKRYNYDEVKEDILAMIPKIGRKKGILLLREYKTIENLIANLDNIKVRGIGKKIKESLHRVFKEKYNK